MPDFVTIPLTRDFVAKVDPEDASLSDLRWHTNLSAPKKPYAVARVDGRRVYMHRVVMAAPIGWDVDHINGDTLDNRRGNLRITTRAENLRNSDRVRTGGAYFDKQTGRWFARVQWNGRRLMLGRDETRQGAEERVRQAKEWLEAGVSHDDVFARFQAQVYRFSPSEAV